MQKIRIKGHTGHLKHKIEIRPIATETKIISYFLEDYIISTITYLTYGSL